MQVYDEFFDRPTSRWARVSSSWLNRAVLENFVKLSMLDPKRLDLLEIGTGKGYIAEASKHLNFRSYTGIEPNNKMAKHSREAFHVEIFEELLPNLLSIDSCAFDTTVAVHVLEHSLNPQEAHEWCAEMLRVTKKNGHVVIVCPDISDYGSFFWDSDWSHSYPTTPKRISQIFNDLGVQVVFSGKLHLGRTGIFSSLFAHIMLILIPTKVKVSLWGMAFVIAKK